jgi:hypothetical protein
LNASENERNKDTRKERNKTQKYTERFIAQRDRKRKWK